MRFCRKKVTNLAEKLPIWW